MYVSRKSDCACIALKKLSIALITSIHALVTPDHLLLTDWESAGFSITCRPSLVAARALNDYLASYGAVA